MVALVEFFFMQVILIMKGLMFRLRVFLTLRVLVIVLGKLENL